MSDLVNFLARVLPTEGYPVISYRSTDEDGKKVWRNSAFSDLRHAAGFAQWLETKGLDVYFACATYRDVEPIPDKADRFRVKRTQANVAAVQDLWADLDIKPEGTHHRSGKDALVALTAACASLRIPFPMVVISGGGLHLHWPLAQAVSPTVWKPVALALERALIGHDVLIDRGVSTDCARILRPVGTLWKKATPHRPVKLYRAIADDAIHSAAWYLERLSAFSEDADATSYFNDVADDEFSGGLYSVEDISADTVADKCRQLGDFRDSQGDVEEPLWYAVLGLLKHCTDGEAVAQDWSMGHPDYDPDVTAAKMAQWKVGPTTCDKFRQLNPSACAGCPHTEAVKTPLRLGRTGTVPQAEEKHPSDRIPGYEWCQSTQRMVAIRRGEEGVERLPFSTARWWVHNYVLENGEASLVLHAEQKRFGRDDTIDEYPLTMSAIGGGGRDLHAKLASFMLTDISGNRQLARSFMLDYQDHLKRTIREIQTYRQFGWINHDEFLMGDRVVTPDKEFEVRLGGQATAKTGVYDTSKPVEDWKHVVENIYNRAHGEPYQFVICSALGSALVPLLGLEEFSGIPIAVTSDESGYGKTTVCWIGLAAWGDVRRGLNVLSGDEASLISIEWQASIFNNLPSLFDEQTNRDGSFTSNMLYMLSNGTARARGTSDGKLREMAPPWRGLNFITGNRNILYKLTENKANPEAAQMRVFEISLDSYPKLETLRQAQELSHALNKVRSGYGQIGVEFIRYVMANREQVKALMDRMPKEYFKGMHHDKERFYVNAAVCALTAGSILRKLGYINFDLKALAEWTKSHILQLRGNVEELRNSPEDNLGRCLTSLCQRLLVTDYLYRGEQDPVLLVRGDVAGRVATLDRKCYITLQAMQDWCMKSGVQWTRFRSSLKNEGLLSDEMTDINTGALLPSIRVNLGRGVKGYTTGSARVVAFNYSKLADTIADLTVPDNVTPFYRGPTDAEATDLRRPG
jgi:Domain of unknown function (DUF927)